MLKYYNNEKIGDNSFWDLSELVKRKSPAPTTFSHAIKLATVSDEEAIKNEDDSEVKEVKEENRLTFQKSPEAKKEKSEKENSSSHSGGAFIYTPEDNSLIKEVRITDEKGTFNFYATFKSDALDLFYEEGTECPFAQYFSYVPQYVQLTKAQKDYYLWWRTCLRRGENIKSDYSYFWLYVYEIINLPDIIPPKEGLLMLCRVWRDYRGALPNIDKNMMVWMCDYCLLHGLSCPREEIAEFLPLVIEESSFKEFYLGQRVFDDLNVEYITSVASDYNWHKSKILKNEKSKELFDRHMNASLRLPISILFDRGQISLSKDKTYTLSYSAFNRSLCGYFNRKHIEIEYRSLSHATSIRTLVTMAVKYAENKLRAMLGVKSRLAIMNLPDEYKNAIDVYFATLPENNIPKMQVRPDYEKLYDALDKNISFGDAMEIEQSSWETARLLATEDEGAITSPTKEIASAEPVQSPSVATVSSEEIKPDAVTPDEPSQNTQSDTYGLSLEYIEFISALVSDDRQKAAQISRTLKKSEESIAEHINEVFSDFFGDVIIEITENGCEILPDYIEEVTEWLNR